MRQTRWLLAVLVVALVAVTVVLVVQARNNSSQSADDVVVVTQTVTNPGTTDAGSSEGTSPEGSTPQPTDGSSEQPSTTDTSGSSEPEETEETSETEEAPAGDRKPPAVPMTKLAPGEKAPQFIIFSFDGTGSTVKLNEFMDVAQESDARFVGFLTGLYMLKDSEANQYTAPGRQPGESSVGFGGDGAEITQRAVDLNRMWAAGHELGTHYNGHFCGGSGNTWSVADWNDELDQAFRFMADYKEINDLPDAPDLKFTPEDIHGGRTPCLEGEYSTLVQSWNTHGMTYDSSMPAPRNGVFWPQKVEGIWEFYMPYVYSPAFEGMVTAMDYNFWVKFNGGADQPETAPELRAKVRETYDYMYEEAFNGNRAPVLIANHLNNWNGNSFNPPAIEFMADTCGKPETYCATYQDVIQWMELQDPEVLDGLINAYPVAEQGPQG